MGILADRLNTMAVRVMSPDQTVRLYMTGGGQLHVEFAKGALDDHTEASLSHQLSISFTRLLRGHSKKRQSILRDAIGEVDDADADAAHAEPPPPVHTRDPTQRQLNQERSRISAMGRSPRAAVTIRRLPGDVMELKLRKGTLQRWSGEEVTAEIQSALAELGRDYHKHLNLLRQQVLSGVTQSEEPRI